MLERALHLLHALRQQIAQRAPQQRRTAHPQGAGGGRVQQGEPQIGVHQDHAPRSVVEERLAERDGPLQVELGVHLAEGAVDPVHPASGAADGRDLGADEDPVAVLGQQREFLYLAARGAPRGGEHRTDLLGVLAAGGPAREATAADGLGRGPAQDALGLAVPVGDRAVGPEGGEGGVHAVQEGGEQRGVVGEAGGSGCPGVRPSVSGAGRPDGDEDADEAEEADEADEAVTGTP